MSTFCRFRSPAMRAVVAGIAAFTLLAAMLVPALRPFLARADLIEVCSATGVRLVRLDGAPAPPKHRAGDHCPSCCVHPSPALAARAAPPGMPAPRVAFADRPPAFPAFATATPDAAWPRGPPRPLF